MADPFAAALAVLHRAAGSVAAVYQPPVGAAIPLRTIHEQPSAVLEGDVPGLVVDTHHFHLRVADVGEPAVGGSIALGADGSGPAFIIHGAPLLDSEGVSWDCPAQPAA